VGVADVIEAFVGDPDELYLIGSLLLAVEVVHVNTVDDLPCLEVRAGGRIYGGVVRLRVEKIQTQQARNFLPAVGPEIKLRGSTREPGISKSRLVEG
jgi:hypothetical protein